MGLDQPGGSGAAPGGMTAGEAAVGVGETTPLLVSDGNATAVEAGVEGAEPLTPGSQAAAWAKEVSTPSGTHLLDPFPGDDTLPGDITPVDEPNHDGDVTPTKDRAARLKLVKVHPRQPGDETDNDHSAERQDSLGGGDDLDLEREDTSRTLKRTESQVSFSDKVESRGPPSVWRAPSQSAKSKYAVADGGANAKSTAPEGCGSPRLRVAPIRPRDPREPRLLTPSTINSLPGGYDDEDRSVCCVIS